MRLTQNSRLTELLEETDSRTDMRLVSTSGTPWTRAYKYLVCVALCGLILLQVGATPSSALDMRMLLSRYLDTGGMNSATNSHTQTIDVTAAISGATNFIKNTPTYNPVIFIPGDGGSQLEARLNKSSRVHYVCDLTSDWYDIWLNIKLLAPLFFDCLCDNMRLIYNHTSRTTYNSPGVEIRPTKFGSLDSVDYLDIARVFETDYFHSIIAALEKNNGFVPNQDMIGAAFDFRKAPNELAEYFDNLTTLIETHYVMNNYKPVTLICHSMGCLNSLYLLNRKSENWKEVYVRRLISLAAPWSGSFKAISAMLYGDNLGIPLLNQSKLQALQSTFPSLMYLFPREPYFARNRVLVETPLKNYTLANFHELFDDVEMPDQREMWLDTNEIAKNLKAPGVELWCLYGTGVETPSKIIYKDAIETGKYVEIQGDGDGTVNLESLRACEAFAAQQSKPVFTRAFDSVDHITILRGQQAADFISTQILEEDLIP